MNKKKYLQNAINCYLKIIFTDKYDFSYLSVDEKFMNNIPNSLFKYMPIKNYTLEMLENNYFYLAPAKMMDDQFDCSANFSKDYIIKLSDEEIKEKACVFYKNYLCKSKDIDISKSDKKFINECIEIYKCKPEESKKRRFFLKKKYNIDDKKINSVIDFVDNITRRIIKEKRVQNGLKTLFNILRNQKRNTGICSLTEVNDSQIMWQMYANKYKGICVEYDFSSWKCEDKKKDLINVLPVIYLDKYYYDPIEIVVKTVLEKILFNKQEERIWADYLTSYYEILTTKHKEWSLQKEWRCLGTPKAKVDAPKIKAIYLGKNIKKVDEDKIIGFASVNTIEVYRLKDNYQTLKIEFERINIDYKNNKQNN